MKTKNSSSTKKSSKSEKGKMPDFCGLKSDKSQEEIVSKFIEESPRVVESSSVKTNVEFPDLDFCGLKSKEGKLKMKSKYNIKKQAMMHSMTLKQEKKKRRLLKERKMLKIEKNAARDVKIKPKEKVDFEEMQLNRMIQNHMSDQNTVKCKKKWYEN